MNYISKEQETEITAAATQVVESVMGKGLTTLRFVRASGPEGRWAYPTYRTYGPNRTREVADALAAAGFKANMECFVDEDGDDDYGRPLIRHIYSVELPEVICEPR